MCTAQATTRNDTARAGNNTIQNEISYIKQEKTTGIKLARCQ
jgi:hypothetical protein